MNDKRSSTYEANPRTKELRPRIKLSDQQVEEVRQARKDGLDPSQIADRTGLPLEDIKIALAPLRTPLSSHRRRTLNASLAVYQHVMSQRRPGEPIKETLDRLILGKGN